MGEMGSRRWMLLLCSFSLFCEQGWADDTPDLLQDAVSIVLTRTDALPIESLLNISDSYFEGYIQALVDVHYYEHGVVVLVKNREVWLANLPKNELTANSIISFVSDVPNVEEVHVLNGVPPEDEEIREKYAQQLQPKGIWFPQTTELFQPLIADPRQVSYTLGYRAGDHVMGAKSVNIAMGDDFPIYRWLEVFPWCGDLQIGIEAGIWSVFDMAPHPKIAKGAELVNTDFYVGVPISYAVNKWSFRFRGYHISSHLGDEFLVNHPGFKRLNPSMEAIDFYTSYQAANGVRLYVGPGVIVHSDKTFKLNPLYVQYGAEFRFFGHKIHHQKLYRTFFLAGHVRNMQYLHWYFDGTYRLGIEFSKLAGVGRKFRFYVGFHHGFSLEGQFMKERTHYFEFNLAYGF